MKKILYIPIILSLLFVAGCGTEDDLIENIVKDYDEEVVITGDPGTADFSNYVSVGASFTAGYMDGALYDAGQRNSYPAIIAAQMKVAGGGDFVQPDINSADGYNTVVSDPANGVILGRFVLDPAIGAPVPIGPGELIANYEGATSGLNNFGVPGARVVDLLSPAYTANPFYARIASAPGTSSVLSDAASAGATFFSLQIGGNDALGWALSGGTNADVADDPAAIAIPGSLTDITNFTGALGAVVATLRAGGAKGVISTIGKITLLPMFNLFPYNAIPMADTTATSTNTAYAAYNGGLAQIQALGAISAEEVALRTINWVEGQNGVLISDDALTDLTAFGLPSIRHAKEGEIILVTASALVGTLADPDNAASVIGVGVPLGDEYTLTEDELTKLNDRVAAFNAAITAQGVAGEVGIVDMETFSDMAVADGGVTVGAVKLGLSIGPNDMFSADFVHPNPRGMAIFANEFIKEIKSEFGADIPMADVLDFAGPSLK